MSDYAERNQVNYSRSMAAAALLGMALSPLLSQAFDLEVLPTYVFLTCLLTGVFGFWFDLQLTIQFHLRLLKEPVHFVPPKGLSMRSELLNEYLSRILSLEFQKADNPPLTLNVASVFSLISAWKSAPSLLLFSTGCCLVLGLLGNQYAHTDFSVNDMGAASLSLSAMLILIWPVFFRRQRLECLWRKWYKAGLITESHLHSLLHVIGRDCGEIRMLTVPAATTVDTSKSEIISKIEVITTESLRKKPIEFLLRRCERRKSISIEVHVCGSDMVHRFVGVIDPTIFRRISNEQRRTLGRKGKAEKGKVRYVHAAESGDEFVFFVTSHHSSTRVQSQSGSVSSDY